MSVYQQHGRADQIDTGQGLQQGQFVVLVFQLFKKPCIKAGDARFGFLNVTHDFVENETMIGGQFAL